MFAPAAIVPEELIRALRSGDQLAISALLKNDLQEAALDLRPDLKKTIADGLAAGALTGFVSGSGPTVAFLVADANAAEEIAQKLHVSGYRALAASGPAAGAFIREEN
jgi:4-diphosphocytidyl-2-C-methyl-D-erythritol kinase